MRLKSARASFEFDCNHGKLNEVLLYGFHRSRKFRLSIAFMVRCFVFCLSGTFQQVEIIMNIKEERKNLSSYMSLPSPLGPMSLVCTWPVGSKDKSRLILRCSMSVFVCIQSGPIIRPWTGSVSYNNPPSFETKDQEVILTSRGFNLHNKAHHQCRKNRQIYD